MRSDKIVDVERLKTITDIDQINLYRDYTNNFHPDDIAKLTPEEILHLNMCDWLDRESRGINEMLKKSGGRKIIDPVTGVEAYFEEYDLFHSLLGEVKPGSISNHTKGGHLSIPELQGTLLDIGEITPFGDGFFDMKIQYSGKASDRFKNNSYFPLGTSIEGAVSMIEDVLSQPKLLKYIIPDYETTQKTFEFINKSGQKFTLRIENFKIKFHPNKV